MKQHNFIQKGNYSAWYEIYNGNSYWVVLAYGTLEGKYKANGLNEAIKMINDYMEEK